MDVVLDTVLASTGGTITLAVALVLIIIVLVFLWTTDRRRLISEIERLNADHDSELAELRSELNRYRDDVDRYRADVDRLQERLDQEMEARRRIEFANPAGSPRPTTELRAHDRHSDTA